MPNDCPQDRCEVCNGRNHRATMCPRKCNCNIGSLHNINDCPNICGCGETPTHLTVNCRFVMHLTLLSEVLMLVIWIVLALLNMWCLICFIWTEIPSNTRKRSRKYMSTMPYQQRYAQELSGNQLRFLERFCASLCAGICVGGAINRGEALFNVVPRQCDGNVRAQLPPSVTLHNRRAV